MAFSAMAATDAARGAGKAGAGPVLQTVLQEVRAFFFAADIGCLRLPGDVLLTSHTAAAACGPLRDALAVSARRAAGGV